MYSATSVIKPTTVVGFVNLGDAADDNINIIITKSLINFLSKIPDSVITSYDQIEKTVSRNGYWKKKTVDKELALTMAQAFDSKQMVVGEYRVDKIKKIIGIKVSVYDVVTGELKLVRNYNGSSGVDLFDTIESMTKNISGLLAGKEIKLVDLKVGVSGSQKSYRLFINGRQAGIISGSSNYSDKIMQEESIEVIIRPISNDQEVYRSTYGAAGNKPIVIEYQPMGNVVVKNMLENGTLNLDGKGSQGISREKTVTLNNIRAYMPHTLELKMKNGSVKKEFSVEEGETSVVIIGADLSVTAPVNYAGVQPLWSLLLPGISQYQARDYGMGTLFLVTAVAGQALFIFSEISFIGSFDSYQKAATSGDAENYYKISETWRNLSITGMALWSGSALLSVLHACFQPGRVALNDPEGLNFNVAYRPEEIQVMFSRRF